MEARLRFFLSAFACFLLAPLRSESQDPENDKWGAWSEWSPCSRTCGVGVTFQERECQEKEKPKDHCKGNKRIYRTCEIQDCPEGSRDFRLEQCEVYNNKTVDGRKYKWVPYIPSDDRCSLNCMPKGEHFYNRWVDKVVDGTTCSMDSYDICVDGKCEKLGCDLILNSNAKEDQCRVCNGNGGSCKTYKYINNEDGNGYKEIFVIPASATNINIQELAPSSNFLALSDSSGNSLLNDNYIIQNPKKRIIAGAVFNYERTSFGQERIFSLGPTTIPVHVKLLFLGEKNPGISYEFSVPKSVINIPERTRFSWRAGEFDKCSKTCAGGEQKRRVFCVRDDSGKKVAKSNCDYEKKPNHRRQCNVHPCPASWFVSGWSTCSRTCARGKQVRRVHCQHIVEGGETEMIADDQCPGVKPTIMRTCQMRKLCPDWSIDQWSKCNVSCGLGFKNRSVTCQTLDTKEILLPESCNLVFKPKTKMQCNPGPCSVTWMASNWSECYPNCGKGMSTRMVYCVTISDKNQKYPDELCDESSRPISDKNCFSEKPCPAMWHATQWSQCTASCGVGMQMRNVMCAEKEGAKILRILPNNQCSKDKKMNELQKCSVQPCQAGWYIYPWESCSKTCGVGMRRRNVKCFADSKEDPKAKWCKSEDKPITEEECFEHECEDVTTPTTPTRPPTSALNNKQQEITKTAITTMKSTTASEAITTEKSPTTKVAIRTGAQEEKMVKATTVPTTKTTKTRPNTTEVTTTKPSTSEDTTIEPPTIEVTIAQSSAPEVTTTQPPTPEVTTGQRSTPEVTTTQTFSPEVTTIQTPTIEITTTQPPIPEVTTTQNPTTDITTTKLPTSEITTTQTPTPEVSTAQRPTVEITTTQPLSIEVTTSQAPSPEVTTTQKPTTDVTTTKPPTSEITTTKTPTPEVSTTQRPTVEITRTQPLSIEVTTSQAPSPEVTTTQKPTTDITTTKPPTSGVTTTKTPTPEVSTAQRPTVEITTTQSLSLEVTTTQAPSQEVTTSKPSTPETTTTQTPTPKVITTQKPTVEITATQPITPKVTTTQPPSPEVTTTQPPTQEIVTTQQTTPEVTMNQRLIPEVTTIRPPTPDVITTGTPILEVTANITRTKRPTEFATTQPLTSEANIKQSPISSIIFTQPSSTTSPAPTTTGLTSIAPPTTLQRVIAAEITEPPEDTMAYKGTEVILRCRATGYPRPIYTWRKGSIPVSSLDLSRIELLSNGDLKISDITEDDDDVYTCTSTNWVGPMDSKRARLSVIVPISVSVSPTNTTVRPGDDGKFTCVSAGVPKPTVEWLKNDNLLTNQDGVKVTETELIVSQVKDLDSGRYTCRAYHDYGANTASAYLKVITKKEPTTPTPKKCEDSTTVAYCPVVKSVGYCCHPFYQNACCQTCKTATCN